MRRTASAPSMGNVSVAWRERKKERKESRVKFEVGRDSEEEHRQA